jgi:hypothetical protein
MFSLTRNDQKHGWKDYHLKFDKKKSNMRFVDDEKREFQEFPKQRAYSVEPFMKKDIPIFHIKPGEKRALYLEHPPLPKKIKKQKRCQMLIKQELHLSTNLMHLNLSLS